MFLLAKNNYNLAASKLKDVAINHFFARSVVEHHVEGKVYVDDLSTPNSFYVLNPYGMSLLYGNVSHRFLNSQLKGYLLGTSGLRKADENALLLEAHFDIDKTRWNVICGSSRFFEHLGMHKVFDLISLQLNIIAAP